MLPGDCCTASCCIVCCNSCKRSWVACSELCELQRELRERRRCGDGGSGRLGLLRGGCGGSGGGKRRGCAQLLARRRTFVLFCRHGSSSARQLRKEGCAAR